MANVKPKTFIKFKVDGTCPSHSRTDVSVRDVSVAIDEPVERGGTNQGLSPTETLLAALAGCTNVITHKVAEAHGVEIVDCHVEVESSFDRRSVLLMEDIDLPFPEMTVTIDLATNAPTEAIEKVKEDLPRFCPVSKVIAQSGTRITNVWNVRPA